jgi:hypothetical protein
MKAKIDNVKAKIDNVKAKIDNVKAKIQDKEEKEHWSRPTLARRLVFGKLAASPTSFPLEESLHLTRQVSASHDKSPPRTTILLLDDKSPPRTTSPVPTGVWTPTHNSSVATNAYGGTNLHVMQNTTAGGHVDGSPRQEV